MPSPKRALLRQARSLQTRQNLIDAAASLWSERGFEKVTVAEVCEKAGVAFGGFYFHFARKEDLLIEVGIGAAYRAARRVYEERASHNERTGDVIAAVLAAVAREVRKVPRPIVGHAMLEAYRLMGVQDPGPRTEAILFETFSDTFRRARDRGELSSEQSAHDVAVVVTTVVQQSLLAWAVERQPVPVKQLLDHFANLVLHGLGIDVTGQK